MSFISWWQHLSMSDAAAILLAVVVGTLAGCWISVQRDPRFVSNATIARRHVGISARISRAFLKHWQGVKQ